jgi:sulfatase maturation enzyme AslB (radical SAM superfamily)
MSKTFCPLPFNHAYIRPDGRWKPCCRFRKNNTDPIEPTTISEYESLNQLLNTSNSLQNIRKKMIAGEKLPGCTSCYLEEQANGKSMRTNEIEKWGGYDQFVHKQPQVTNVELTFGNYCNLACRICAGELSTSWHKDEQALRPFYPERHGITTRVNVMKKWNTADFEHLTRLKITGGEPCLHPDFLAFLDSIKDHVSQNITLELFTNSSFVPKQHLLDKLSKFKQANIWLSIDGTGAVQEYSRHGSSWPVVEASARRWLEYQNSTTNVAVNLAPTVSLYNIHNICELIDWFLNLREQVLQTPEQSAGCNWNVTTWPQYLDIQLLPQKQTVIEQITAYRDTISQYPNYQELLSRVLERLQETGNQEHLVQFVEYNKDLDLLRDQQFDQVLPELCQQIQQLWQKHPGRLK